MTGSHQNNLSEELLTEENYRDYQFSVPWQYGTETGIVRDVDGFTQGSGFASKGLPVTREAIHREVWTKFHYNPHVNTSTRGLTGRIAGNGFATVSDIQQIQEVIDEEETDYRNRLYDYWPKFITRAFIGGELFLCYTVHDDGFVEIDFVAPDVVKGDEVEHGIIFHPKKTRMPLVYCIKDDENDIEEHIPSIYLARYPELYQVAKQQKGFSAKMLDPSRTKKKAFRAVGGFNRFIVSWDLGLITDRSTSHLLTVLQWLNHWENLKKYEIDHKKSAGAYVWAVKFTDIKSWITWLNLTDEQRAKTGIAQPKSPGSTMVLGPNMDLIATNPNLQKISESDTDIMQMISSGLNEPEDVTTGQAKGTFASVKASRGPMSDKISDEMAYFERWLRWDFWGNIFFLKSKIADFPETFAVEEAVDFDKNQNPVFKTLQKKPERCIDILFPASAITNTSDEAKALLGVKHGSLNDTVGIPNETLATKMGFRGYKKMRLKKATEDKKYPRLITTVDQESFQERREAEPKRAAGKGEDEEEEV